MSRRPVLTRELVAEVHRARAAGASYRALATEFELSIGSVANAIAGRLPAANTAPPPSPPQLDRAAVLQARRELCLLADRLHRLARKAGEIFEKPLEQAAYHCSEAADSLPAISRGAPATSVPQSHAAPSIASVHGLNAELAATALRLEVLL